MYSVDYTNRFKKDLKRCVKRGLDIGKIIEAVKLLETYGQLPTKYKPQNWWEIDKGNGNVTYNQIG